MKRLALATVAAVLLTPGVAHAATLVNQDGTLTFTGGAAESDIEVSGSSPVILAPSRYSDGDRISVQGCIEEGTPATGQRFVCGGVTRIVIDFGAGDDSLLGSGSVPMTIAGGPGADNLSGGGAPDSISGGPGDDRLQGYAGDTVSGGTGIDTLLFLHQERHTAPIAYSLDGVANDGPGLNVLADVEDLRPVEPICPEGCGPIVVGPLTLIGSDAGNRLIGGGDADIITGGGGADTLLAGYGNDTIDARDGVPDRVMCGPGEDTVLADAADALAGCEHVQLSPGSSLFEDHAPALAWALPAAGARLSPGAATTLEVTAGDDYGVQRVRFRDDDRVLCTVTEAPFRCAYTPRPQGVGRNLLIADVTDGMGQTTTATRAITVGRYAAQSVSLRVTRRGTRYVATGKVTLPKGPSCAGTVTVSSGQVRSRAVRLAKNCTYRATLTVPGTRRPRFVATYSGTDIVAGKRSRAS